jgi:hypothetical protein
MQFSKSCGRSPVAEPLGVSFAGTILACSDLRRFDKLFDVVIQ